MIMKNQEIRAWIENGDPEQYKNMKEKYEIERKKWEEKHGIEVIDFVALLEMPIKPSRISYNDIGISIHVYGLYGTYDISWFQIKPTRKDIFGWIFCLTEKRWCDAELINDFLQLVCAHYKIEVNDYFD